jgi:hypothetical protein
MKRTTLRAVLLSAGLAISAGGAFATTMTPDAMVFRGLFAQPAVRAAALHSPAGARFAAKLQLTNTSGAPLRVSTTAAVRLELLDARGTTVPFAGGSNIGRAVRAADAVPLAAGKSLDIPVSGVFRLAGRELSWRGDDGVMGTWAVDPAAAYSLRLRYRGLDGASWQGEGASLPAPLPLRG